jgi:hypothetical protein
VSRAVEMIKATIEVFIRGFSSVLPILVVISSFDGAGKAVTSPPQSTIAVGSSGTTSLACIFEVR